MECVQCKRMDEATARSQDIDRGIQRDRRKPPIQKLLLLGSGESGKTTIVRNMKVLYLDGFSAEEKGVYRNTIFRNIVSSMIVLLQEAQKSGLELEDGNADLGRTYIEKNSPKITQLRWFLDEEDATETEQLWKDDSIQKTFRRSHEFQLIDSAPYYFAEVTRIGRADYVPTTQDILRCRSRTTTIQETSFEMQDTKCLLVDVGGQRSERRKWIHAFQDVTAVLFISSLSEYNQVLREDNSVNRMRESLLIFESIVNSKWLKDTNVILFLNKKDLFEEKLKDHPLTGTFSKYKGGLNYENARAYIERRFMRLVKHPESRQGVYVHTTCAVDPENIRFVFDAIKDIILQKNMGRLQ